MGLKDPVGVEEQHKMSLKKGVWTLYAVGVQCSDLVRSILTNLPISLMEDR